MSAILASVLPDFSDAVTPPAPRAIPGMPFRVVKRPLQPMTVPEALNALQVLVTPAATPLDSPWAGLKRSSPLAEAEPAETPEERAASIAEAEARGREQGRAEARAEALAALEAEREAFAVRLAEERARWCESESERLSSGFAAALAPSTRI